MKDAPAGMDAVADAANGATADAADGAAADAADASDGDGGCGDTMTDPNNCGRCGHGCCGGVCQAGTCHALPIVSNSAGASGIAVDSTNVYWIGAAVWKCAVTGCNNTPTQLARFGVPTPIGVASDGTSVYFTALSEVMQCAIGGCQNAPTVLATNLNTASAIAIYGGDIYFTDEGTGDVMSCPSSGCGGAPTMLVTGSAAGRSVAVDANYVYWGNAQGVAAVPTGGGPVIQLDSSGWSSIAIDDSCVYFTNYDTGTVSVVAKP
jgi:hypothetical protein